MAKPRSVTLDGERRYRPGRDDEEGIAVGDTLTEGQKLVKGESLTSSNGAYTLTLQDDGNLVLASRGHAIWASGTNGEDVVRAEVQTDGNFVVYTADKPVWHTDTKGKKNVRLVLQDDRNLVLYSGDGAAWSSKTETDAPPPPEPEAAAPAAPEPAAEEAAASEPEPEPEAARDIYRRIRRHVVGHLRAVLRRRQQVPDHRRCQRHLQPGPDPAGTGTDYSLIAGERGGPAFGRRAPNRSALRRYLLNIG